MQYSCFIGARTVPYLTLLQNWSGLANGFVCKELFTPEVFNSVMSSKQMKGVYVFHRLKNPRVDESKMGCQLCFYVLIRIDKAVC